jgi:uncharacterized delta-60 repeat protein
MTIALMFLLLLAATPANAAKPGSYSVDRSFGTRGTISRGISPNPEGLDTPAEFAVAPSGKVILSSSHTLVRYRKNGKVDSSFGKNGEVAIEELPGARFRLAGVAVDSKGRILVAGTVIDPSHITPGPQYGFRLEAELGVVLRYTSTGEPDPNFGDEGVVSSTFGRPPPTFTTGSPPSTFHYESPVVGLAGIAVDPEDRPLLTGVGVEKMGGCRDSFYGSQRIYEGFAARLTARGLLDPSFGESGVRAIGALPRVNRPLFDPKGDGVVFTGNTLDGCPAESGLLAVAHLSHRGNLDQRFGPAGWRGFEGGFETSGGGPAAVDDRGRILLLRTDEAGLGVEIARLRPDGDLDGSFGHKGVVPVPLAAQITSIAVDARGRVLLAGWRRGEPCTRCGGENNQRNQRFRNAFELLRLRRNGRPDPRFAGPNGLSASFPRAGATTEATAQQILLDRRGHILVGGNIASNRFSSGLGAGLIRYRAQR